MIAPDLWVLKIDLGMVSAPLSFHKFYIALTLLFSTSQANFMLYVFLVLIYFTVV